MSIKIEYDGSYPNLCSGQLIVTIDGKVWTFPAHCMHSGGSTYFTNGYAEEHVEQGEWSIGDWPKGFPIALRCAVEEAVNREVHHGCCGGCL